MTTGAERRDWMKTTIVVFAIFGVLNVAGMIIWLLVNQ